MTWFEITTQRSHDEWHQPQLHPFWGGNPSKLTIHVSIKLNFMIPHPEYEKTNHTVWKKTLHDMLVGCHTGSSKQHLLILGGSSPLVSGHLLTGMILQVIGTKQQTAVRTDCCSNEEAHILSYTPGKLASRPWKMVVGRPCGFVLGPGNFPGSTLNFGGCTTILI